MKVAFLFGAGAEGEESNYGLPYGSEYFLKTVYAPSEKYFKALKGHFEKRYFESCKYTIHQVYAKNRTEKEVLRSMTMLLLEQYPNAKNVNEYEISQLFFGVNFILSIDNLNELKTNIVYESYVISELNKRKSKQDTVFFDSVIESTIEEFNSIVVGKKDFTPTSFLILQLVEKTGSNYSFKFPISSSGFFEKYFHTIINPSKYSNTNFMKIFNYYWSCYFLILESILTFLDKQPNNDSFLNTREFNRFFTKERNINFAYLLSNLDKVTNFLYSLDLNKISTTSYYVRIREAIDNAPGLECVGVLTTNYFRFPSLVSKNVAYLNGEMKLFEFPEVLEVRDCSLDIPINRNQIFFPFIFGQSMLKPIVHSAQTEQYHTAHSILNEADCLIILGYNINEDDNHINAFLHDFVDNQGKKLIFVNNDKNFVVSEKLRLVTNTPNAYLCHVDYNSGIPKVVDNIFSYLNSISSKMSTPVKI